MTEYYKYVVSIPGSGAKVSYDCWASPSEAEEKGKQWAERQNWLKDQTYEISSQLVDD